MPPTPSRPHRYRALVADDEFAYRAAIARLLAPLGFACVEAADGVAGADLLADVTEPFDLAITDFRMPRGSGWRVVEAARVHRGSTFPVIMQTGEAQYPDVYLVAAERRVPLIAKRDIASQLVALVLEVMRLPMHR